QDKKEREVKVPEWVINMIYKCLKKKPENRFANGMELHDNVIHNGIHTIEHVAASNYLAAASESENNIPADSQIQEQLNLFRERLENKEKELDHLKALVRAREGEAEVLQNAPVYQASENRGVPKAWFVALLLLTIAIAGFSAYTYINSRKQVPISQNATVPTDDFGDTATATVEAETPAATMPVIDTNEQEMKRLEALRRKQLADSIKAVEKARTTALADNSVADNANANIAADEKNTDPAKTAEAEKPKTKSVQYMVVSKAYFYNSPDETTRRGLFINPSNESIVTLIEDKEDFVYVTFVDRAGQTNKGWLRKKDLQQINE
ncbi:MAG TPA: hypothetical protein VF623_09630, partial [Segetibacter sp.]